MRSRLAFADRTLCGHLLPGLLAISAASLQAQSVSDSRQAVPGVAITLQEAIHRAEQNEPNFAASRAAQQAAALDRGLARAALLPGVVYHNQALYTQPNGAKNQAGPSGGAAGATGSLSGGQPAPVFIANNAVREYASQAVINETLGVAQAANVRVATAVSARATAELEIARRGLVAATANLYYGVAASERRLAVLRTAQAEAADFVALTGEREAAREAAHADVLKADLALQGRTRDVTEAMLARDRARLELASLLFADPLTPYTLDLPSQPAPLPAIADVAAAAKHGNPELASAVAALEQGNAEVLVARAAYLPDLALNFTYGIDASYFATKSPYDGTINPRNLGYSMAATLDIPVWDWFSTERRIKQSEGRRDAVRVALTATQKRLVIDLQVDVAEAATAQSELLSLDTTVRTAEESLRLTRLRYTGGEGSALEVVDAETALSSARTAREDGQVRYEQALSGLEILTGTL